MDFSNWLLNKLREKGWNQAELATRAGVTRTAISDVISGRRNAGPDLCSSIARALDLPPEAVFRAAGLLPPVSPESEVAQQILHLLSQLPPDEQRRYLDLLRFEVERQRSFAAKQKSREKPRLEMS